VLKLPAGSDTPVEVQHRRHPERHQYPTVSPSPVAGWACQRALAVADNVVIDVSACGGLQSDSAYNIAQQIAAKVTT
jgi:hypothetical protein